jgi:hypothetical protein
MVIEFILLRQFESGPGILGITDKLEQAIEEGLKKAETLRQSILKKAFEGKLV